MMVVATGIESISASSMTSSAAPADMAPPPALSTGKLALTSMSAARCTSSSAGPDFAGGADRGVGHDGVIGLGGEDVLGHFEDDGARRAGAQGGEGRGA